MKASVRSRKEAIDRPGKRVTSGHKHNHTNPAFGHHPHCTMTAVITDHSLKTSFVAGPKLSAFVHLEFIYLHVRDVTKGSRSFNHVATVTELLSGRGALRHLVDAGVRTPTHAITDARDGKGLSGIMCNSLSCCYLQLGTASSQSVNSTRCI